MDGTLDLVAVLREARAVDLIRVALSRAASSSFPLPARGPPPLAGARFTRVG